MEPFANEAARHSGENALRCIFNEVELTDSRVAVYTTDCAVKLKFPNGELF